VSPLVRIALKALGLGALVAGGLAVALVALIAAILIGPLVFWLAWNVLNFAHAMGLPELKFWGIVLATLFLVAGWAGKAGIAALVFLIDPSWFHGSAQARWPEPTLRNFVAVVLLALLAARPHSHAHKHGRKTRLIGG
jgi:hypothetical protein